MADTSVQVAVEEWVREWLRKEHNEVFVKKALDLKWGGKFEVDAWSESGIVACISTSRYKTSAGKAGSGKVSKIYKDLLFMLNVQAAKKRYLIVTEEEMYKYFQRRRNEGRFPPEEEVQLKFVDIPDELRQALEQSRETASAESRSKK